jgi:hypothetical protein
VNGKSRLHASRLRRANTPRSTDYCIVTTPPTTQVQLYLLQYELDTMSKQETVVEQKQVFIQSRKHLLSRGIPPSERLRTIAEDGGIELSVLKGVLDKGAYPAQLLSNPHV